MSKCVEVKMQSDYRDLHKTAKKALYYEHELYAGDSYDSCIWEIEKDILVKEIGLIKKNKIKYLDFACGTGRILSFVEQYVSVSTGLDISENMLNVAKDKVKKSVLLNCDLTKRDIIGNEQYDLITAFRFFLNAQEDLRMKIFLLLADKLAKDGIFIFNIHGNILSYYLIPVVLQRLNLKKGQEKLGYLSYFKIHKLIRNSNLKIKRMYGVGVVPSSFYRLFASVKKFFMDVDSIFSKQAFLKYFARNLIFVCIKE